jgi:hypothetical protein
MAGEPDGLSVQQSPITGIASGQRWESRTALSFAAGLTNQRKEGLRCDHEDSAEHRPGGGHRGVPGRGAGDGAQLAEIGQLRACLVLQPAAEEEVTIFLG